MRLSKHVYFFVFSFFTLPAFAQIYVNQNASCNPCDGSSWDMAFTDLQEALAVADQSQAIWVAQGTYKPHPTDRTIAFNLSNGLKIYGGFSGTESILDQRDIEAFPTILSGDLNDNDGIDFLNNEENSHTIIYTQQVSELTIVDGFTIKGGNANDFTSPSPQHRSGGGWYNDIPWGTYGTSSPTIRNCTFESNFAHMSGGGLFNSGSVGESYTRLFNCTFKNNKASIGGGIYNEANNGVANIDVINCYFIENEAIETGGGMYNFALNNGDVSPNITNTVFFKNEAYSAAGFYSLVIVGTAFSTLTNCTFYANNANIGGAVYLNTATTGFCETTIINSIFWGSTSAFDPFFHFSGDGTPRIYLENTIVDAADCSALLAGDNQINCTTGTILYNQDPMFVNAEEADFHLLEGSPAIDAGSNAAIESTGIQIDIDGGERIVQSTVDLGVDEWKILTDVSEEEEEERDYLIGEAAIQIAPLVNPTGQVLELQHKKHGVQQYNYRLFNILGQRIASGRLEFVGGRSSIQLSETIQAGTYFLQLNGLPQSIKFVKQ